MSLNAGEGARGGSANAQKVCALVRRELQGWHRNSSPPTSSLCAEPSAEAAQPSRHSVREGLAELRFRLIECNDLAFNCRGVSARVKGEVKLAAEPLLGCVAQALARDNWIFADDEAVASLLGAAAELTKRVCSVLMRSVGGGACCGGGEKELSLALRAMREKTDALPVLLSLQPRDQAHLCDVQRICARVDELAEEIDALLLGAAPAPLLAPAAPIWEAYAHLLGVGRPKNVARARQLFEKEAATSAEANNALGRLSLDGLGAVADRESAFRHFSRAAEMNDSVGLFYAALLLEEGCGAWLGDRAHRAAELYRQSAAQGNPDAQCNLGYLHESGALGRPDFAKAQQLYQQAAEGGHARALNSLATLQLRGQARGAEPALALLERSRQLGFTKSLLDLGKCHLFGQGTGRDVEAARDCFREAARRKQPEAFFFLGYLRLTEGLAQRASAAFDEAEEFFRFALLDADNHAEALFYLGFMAEHGLGLPASRLQALALYQRSATARLGQLALHKLADIFSSEAWAPTNLPRALLVLQQLGDRRAKKRAEELHARGVRAEGNAQLLAALRAARPPADLPRLLGLDRIADYLRSRAGGERSVCAVDASLLDLSVEAWGENARPPSEGAKACARSPRAFSPQIQPRRECLPLQQSQLLNIN